MIKAPQGGGGNRVPQDNIAAGVYPARVVQVVDLGVQAQRPFQGQEKKPVNEIMLGYELVDTFLVDENGNELEDKPRWISETIPLHPLIADKAKSTKRYEALDPGKQFDGDFSQLVNIPCNVTVINNENQGKVYDNVAGVAAMRPRDAAKCPELKNPAKVFSLEAPDLQVFNSLPKWIQEKIQKNLNYQGSKLQILLGGKAPAPKKEEPEDYPVIGGLEDQGPEQKPW